MERLYIILLGIIQSEPNDSIDCQIANYLLEHIQDLNDITANDLAQTCQVSKSSISRFTRRVGLNDFYELKHMLHHYQHNLTKFDFTSRSDNENSMIQYIETVSQHIQDLRYMLDFDAIDEITDDIYHYPKVIIAGSLQANSVCLSLQVDLFSSGKVVQAKVKYTELREIIDKADSQTLIIVLSSTGRFFQRLFVRDQRLLKKDKPKIYLITASAKLNQLPYVDKAINLHTLSDYASGTFQLELIANLIARRYNEKIRTHYFDQ